MKILFVSGEADYDALSFVNKYGDVKASSIIERFEEGEVFVNDDEDGKPMEDWVFSLKIIEVGDVDMKFYEFVRQYIQDYDDSKHSNFWLENEIVA